MSNKKEYKGKVIREFSVISGDGKKPSKKTYKVGDAYSTNSSGAFESLKQQLKIK